MKIFELLAALVLILITLPLILIGSVVVISNGRWPLFRTAYGYSSTLEERLLEFNVGPGQLGQLLWRSSWLRLPSLFSVVRGRAELRDVISALEHRHK